jgi:MoaA/NifB/PqqE/SkfB family radical SAM enzyme
MDLDLYRKVIDDIRHYAREVILNIGGEPLMNKRLPEFVQIASDAGLYVKFDSNAMLLNERWTEKILNSPLDEITFSFDCADKATYQYLRARAKFAVVIKNMQYFLNEKKRRGQDHPRVVLQSIKMFTPGKPLDVGDAYRKIFEGLPVDEFRGVWAHDWVGTVESGKYALPPRDKSLYHPCRLLWKNITISWDGNVYLCCLDLNRQDLVDNVKNKPVLDIWYGPRMAAARKKLTDERHSETIICGNCDLLYERPEYSALGLKRLVQENLRRMAKRPAVT